MLLDDLWWEQNSSTVSILALVYLLLAFKNINHGILLGQLWKLRWKAQFLFGLFPSSRTVQLLLIWSKRSSSWPLFCGVLQDPVYSPLIFNIYMKVLGKIIHHYGIRYDQYAEITQMYVSIMGKVSDD